tara:strand:- start:1822 stop:2121 length:300 start_codon:yes stop_codon:yes gene_type:complete
MSRKVQVIDIMKNTNSVVTMSDKDFGEALPSSDTVKKQELELLRQFRNTLLAESDWTQVVDSTLNEQQKNEWKVYRQKLRDITNSYFNLSDVKWPTKPE